MGVLTNKQKAEEYRQLAYQCVANESNNTCDMGCVNCPLNIAFFMDDKKEAVLIKMAAMRDYQNDLAQEQARNELYKRIESEKTAADIGAIIAALIPIGLIIWLISSIKSCFSG